VNPPVPGWVDRVKTLLMDRFGCGTPGEVCSLITSEGGEGDEYLQTLVTLIGSASTWEQVQSCYEQHITQFFQNNDPLRLLVLEDLQDCRSLLENFCAPD
jgi:hypothetical protein